jgi:hypothetical protein
VVIEPRWRLDLARDVLAELRARVAAGDVAEAAERAADVRACYVTEHDRQLRLRLWQRDRV